MTALLLAFGTFGCGRSDDKGEEITGTVSEEETEEISEEETEEFTDGISDEDAEEVPDAVSEEEMKEFFRKDPEDEDRELHCEYALEEGDHAEYKSAYCYLDDPEGLEKELMKLKWVRAEETELTDFYSYDIGKFNEIRISKNGSMERSEPTESFFLRLAGKSDIKKLGKILDKYFFIDDYQELALALTGNEYNFDNFTANYTFLVTAEDYEKKAGDGDYIYNFSGMIKREAGTDTTYMTGEGIYKCKDSVMEYAARDRKCAYSLYDKESGEIKWTCIDDYTYGELSGLPYNVYYYVYQTLWIDLRMASVKAHENNYDKKNFPFKVSRKNGLTEYNYSIPDTAGRTDYPAAYTIVLNDSGQLISVEEDRSYGKKKLFRLEDYKFDSDSFTMEDVDSRMESFAEKEGKKR